MAVEDIDLAGLPIVTFIWSADPGDRDSLSWISPSAEDLFGYAPAEILASPRLITFADSEIEIWKMRRPVDDDAIWCFESSCEAKGARLWWRAVARSVPTGGEGKLYHGVIFDVSDLKMREAESENRRRSLESSVRRLTERSDQYATDLSDALQCLDLLIVRDPGTGALSWQHFADNLRTEYYRARRHHQRMSVVEITLTGLEAMGVRRGEAAVDELLSTLIIRLSPMIRPIDLIGRLDDSRFAMLLPGTSGGGAEAVAGRLTKAMNEVLDEAGARELGVQAKFEIREVATDDPSSDVLLADLIKS